MTPEAFAAADAAWRLQGEPSFVFHFEGNALTVRSFKGWSHTPSDNISSLVTTGDQRYAVLRSHAAGVIPSARLRDAFGLATANDALAYGPWAIERDDAVRLWAAYCDNHAL